MSISISGSSGYIGRNILPLLQQKHDLVALPSIPVQSATDVISSPAIATGFPSSSVTNLDILAHIHLGWKGTPSCEVSWDVVMQNIESAHHALLVCNVLQIPLMIFFSSGGAIYGQAEPRPIPEDHECNPLSQYGLCKYYAELRLQETAKALKYTKLVILRPSNIYGGLHPVGKPNGVVNIFASKIRNGMPIILQGPDTVRDFLHVKDLASCLELLLQEPPTCSQVLNVGSGQGLSLADLVRLLYLESNSKISQPQAVSSVERPLFEPSYNVLNIDRLHVLSGWKPTISLSEGLRLVLSGL